MVRGNTKERIAQTAIRLFNERGTAAVSTNHIAEAAGISPGNLYYHFRNKEEIIRTVFERMIDDWNRLSANPEDQPLVRVRGLLEKTFAILWEYRFFYREFVALIRRDAELGRQYRIVRVRGLADTEALLMNLVAAGVLREPEETTAVQKLAKVLWLITEFWLPFAEMGDTMIGPERLQEGIELMMQVLRPYMTEVSVAEPG